MSEHDIIDRRLAELAALTGWHPHQADLMAEATDHLVTRAEDLCRTDRLSWADAQTRAVEAFGQPLDVAVAAARSRSGGLALPTRFTRTCGAVAFIGGLVLPTCAATLLLAGDSFLPEAAFGALVMLAFAGLAAVAFGLVGVVDRVGSSEPAKALAIGGALVWAALVATVYGWAAITLLILPFVAVLLVRWQRLIGRTSWLAWVVVGAVPAATAFALCLWVFGDRTIDEWGMYWGAELAMLLAVLVIGIGSLAIGRELYRETPAPAELVAAGGVVVRPHATPAGD